MNRLSLNIIVNLLAYGFVTIVILGLATFVQGTGDFSQWPKDERGFIAFCLIVGWLFALLPLEVSGCRESIVKALEHRP